MHALIAAQAAFCFVVLFVSGLFVTTFDRLAYQHTGFPTSGLLALDVVTARDEPPSAWNQVVEHLRSVSGIESAALCEWPLLDGSSYRLNHVSVDGGRPSEMAVRFLIVSPGWIETMKIPLIEGRDLRANETEAAIVNREFAREFFAGKDAAGKLFTAKPGGEWGRRFQIVGIVGDTRYRTIRDPILPVAYVPYRVAWHKETIMVGMGASNKTAAPSALTSILRNEVSRASPDFRVINIRSQQEMLQAQMVRERLLALLAVFFATIALLLAGIGLYGVLDYSVLQRRREIGLRIALGAQPGDIIRQVALGMLGWFFGGSLAGFALGIGCSRSIETLLYEVKATDLGALAGPALALMAAAFAAALPPLVRAVRIDPARTLRSG